MENVVFSFWVDNWLIIVGLFVVVSVALIYNTLITKKNRVEKSLSNIDAFLQQRLDQMENLFILLDNALDHESKVYDDISRERTGFNQIKDVYQSDKTSAARLVQADSAMSSFLKGARATFERYPELNAIDTVEKVILDNVQIEMEINASRRQYNSNVTLYRNAIKMFPNNIVAIIFRFADTYELYRADEEAQQAVRPTRRG